MWYCQYMCLSGDSDRNSKHPLINLNNFWAPLVSVINIINLPVIVLKELIYSWVKS